MDIKGIIPPILTPLNEDESLNIKALDPIIERELNAGVHGIFCLGTNGEFYALETEEKEQVIEATVQAVKGRVPVYAGTGCVTTRETIRLSQKAKDMGADILSIICPYFAAASQQEIYEHYVAVAKAVDLPIVIYNIPARAGVNIAPQTVESLSLIDNIVAVKDSSGNFDNMLQYIELTRGRDFSVISGNDSLILWNLLAGGAGGISGVANVYPHTMVSIYEYFKAGDMEKARSAQDSIRSFRNCFRFGNANTIVKIAAGLRGNPVGPCRAPFHSITEEGMNALKKVLEQNEQLGMD